MKSGEQRFLSEERNAEQKADPWPLNSGVTIHLGFVQRLIKVPKDIRQRFQPHREPNHFR